MRRSLLSLVLLGVLAAPLHGASDQDFDDCENGDNLDRLIAACTRVAEDCKEDSETRSDAYYNLGQAYSRKRDRDRSIASYSEAVRFNPKNTWALYNRASGYLTKRDYDRAIADVTAGVSIDPKVAWGYLNRAIAYHVKGNLDAALADYQSALALDAKFPHALYGRGLVRLKKGDAAGEADIAAARAIAPEAGRPAAEVVFSAHGLK